MSIAPITESQRKHVEKEIGYDENHMLVKSKLIKEWMKKQPHFPIIPEKYVEKLIIQFLIGTKMSTEKAKSKMDTYFAMRHQIPDIFYNRDPCQKYMKDSVDRIRYFPLSELTPDGCRVHIFSYNPAKDLRFTPPDIKGFYARIMAINCAQVVQKDFNVGIYVVEDCRGFYTSHIAEVPWPFALKSIAYCQEGLPIRIKGIIVINAPAYRETVMNILKPALKEKIRKRIHTFQGDHTNLYKFIPQRILPSDYGGEAPSIEESSRNWQKTLESMKDFFAEEEKYITDESKRPKDSLNDSGQLFGINGTFTKLNID